MTRLTRRSVLRTIVGGSAVTVALPFLDCLLNTNGTALADGRPLPLRFGTWFWGLGVTPGRSMPTKLGADYDLLPELMPLAPYQNQVSVLSGYSAHLDGRTNLPHYSGMVAMRTGSAPVSNNSDAGGASLDVLISDQIGTRTRFRSIDMACTGNPRDSYSRRSLSVVNPSEVSPAALYTRLFGAGFQDPNSSEFKPDARILARRSVLTGTQDQRRQLAGSLGANDRARLDEYFTSVRQLEQQLALQLEKPAPAEACSIPQPVQETPIGPEIGQTLNTHKLMTQLLTMALTCNQTQCFNMVFSASGSNLRKPGSTRTHHTLTHDEPLDPSKGFQPEATFFVEQSMEAWAHFVGALAGIKEGNGTLLDNTLVLAHSDCSFAKVHSITGIPVMIAGRAGGRIKSGIHIAGNDEPISRIGLTVMRALGVPMDKWGTSSLETSKEVGDLIA